MSWIVKLTKKADKQQKEMPKKQRELLALLAEEIKLLGPVRGNWPNYSKLADGSHHCHLKHPKWIACWRETVKGIEVEVYYAGSRKDAPY